MDQGGRDWSLTDTQREDTVSRLAQNIASLAFSAGASVSDNVARDLAVNAERKSYTVARVEARTTTGVRPHAETLRAYTRKLGTLAIEAAQRLVDEQKAGENGSVTPGPGVPHDDGGEAQLDLTGDREFLVEETAREHLSPLLEQGAGHTQIKLSTKSFGREAAAVASEAILNIADTLTHVDMSDIIAGRPEDEALEALRVISAALARAKLRHLDLSDNALGEKGVRALADSFQGQAALEKLAFQNVGCSIHACIAVEELMQNTSELRIFHFHNNMSGDEGAAAIAQVVARAPQMEDFKMASSRVGPSGGIALLKALGQGNKLVKLDLSDNPLTPEVAAQLAGALQGHHLLEHLNLNDTSLGDEGVAVLAEALPSCAPRLHTLELALNEITAEGAKALADCLPSKAELRRLNLRENELEDEGAAWIAKGLASLDQLETVDLCANQIKRPGAVGLAEVLSQKSNLKLLALDENCISEAGVEQVKDHMEKAGKLDALGSLEENDPEEDEDAEDDDDEEGQAGDEDDGGLAASLAATHIA